MWEYINEASNKTTLYYNSTDGQWIMEYFIWIDGGWMPVASNYATGTMYDQSIYFPETTLTVTRTTHFTGKLAKESDIPTKTSQLSNDNNYVNEATLAWNYYNKTQIDGMIGDIDSVLDAINGEVI